ncbi:MAG: hypothetical protein JEZ14_06780 [Marinilabiliaceae bacterium]|nr:hypothetical protein [Marinilabiliaceae bacterium]MBI9061676.1 hypothetical protein [Marinilabiliaceae bacterium]
MVQLLMTSGIPPGLVNASFNVSAFHTSSVLTSLEPQSGSIRIATGETRGLNQDIKEP